MRIGVDIMGSETPSDVLFDGVLKSSQILGNATKLCIFASKDVIKTLSTSNSELKDSSSIEFFPTGESILMDDSPLYVVRRKKDSSLSLAIKMIKDKEIDAFVTAGNTGALTALASIALNKLHGITRPALLTSIPSEDVNMAVLDVGAHVASDPELILQFAQLGASYQKVIGNMECPRVGLLNIGVESIKGTRHSRLSYNAIKQFCQSEGNKNLKMNFVGNFEGQRVFQGGIDVLVTDGFTGNVFLKTCEGITAFILDHIKRKFFQMKEGETDPLTDYLSKFLNYQEYPGAVLMGVEGVVIKCHGYSSSKAMQSGILGAAHFLQQDFLNKIKTYFPK